MLKGLFVLGNLMAMFIYQWILADVSITQTIPEILEPGKEYPVEIKISKGDLVGFGQVKINFPDGITARADNQAGSTFTFKDQSGRFVWMSLPEDEEIILKYILLVDAAASGSKSITGKFSYLEDNTPKTYAFPNKMVTIIPKEKNSTNTLSATGLEKPVYTRTIFQNDDGSFDVNIMVNKGYITGFARLKEQLPAGFAAKQNAVYGAIFTHANGSVKFIWTELPKEKVFRISYILYPNAAVSGDFNITGEFSYLINDVTHKVIPDPTTFTVIQSTVADHTETHPPTKTTIPKVSCKRTITMEGENRFKVEVYISKDMAEGIAQMKETIPAGFYATEGETRNARFSFENRTAKFVWSSLPAPTGFTVSYYLEPKENISGSFNVNGEFSCLAGKKTIKNTCGPTSFNVTPLFTDNKNKITNIPDPATGIRYRVQICAGHKKVSERHFKKYYKYTEMTVNQEAEQGWFKYTIGSYKNYPDARNQRNMVTQAYDFPGPFIAAYNDGHRVTVQEALMLSGQQWIK